MPMYSLPISGQIFEKARFDADAPASRTPDYGLRSERKLTRKSSRI
jgi:hypothetical protein